MSTSDPRTIDTRLEQALASVRKDKDLTQVAVAARLRKPQSFVSKYETGELRLTVGHFVAVCEALEVDPSVVMRSVLDVDF